MEWILLAKEICNQKWHTRYWLLTHCPFIWCWFRNSIELYSVIRPHIFYFHSIHIANEKFHTNPQCTLPLSLFLSHSINTNKFETKLDAVIISQHIFVIILCIRPIVDYSWYEECVHSMEMPPFLVNFNVYFLFISLDNKFIYSLNDLSIYWWLKFHYHFDTHPTHALLNE